MRLRICREGMTRLVILIGPYAVKVPWAPEWRLFLLGMVGNLAEARWKDLNHPGLCKVYYTSSTGLFAIYERLRPVKHTGLFIIELARLCAIHKDLPESFWLSDAKPNNFGYRGTELVKLDFAN